MSRPGTMLVMFLLAGASAPASAQSPAGFPTDTLAVVGAHVVTARDLIERLDLMPWPGKDRPAGLDSVKRKALQSLVAERILANESAAEGLGSDEHFRMRAGQLEELFVRDELYKQQVAAKVSVTDEEIREGLQRYAWRVTVLMLTVRTEEDAAAITAALRDGTALDTLFRNPPIPYPVLLDTVTVTFGMLKKPQEDAVFSLRNRQPISGPVPLAHGAWAVLSFLRRELNPDFARRSVSERQAEVHRKVRARKELVAADRYSARVLAPERAEADQALFRIFAEAARDVLCGDSTRYRNETGFRLDLIVDTLERSLGPHLGEILIHMKGRGMTLQDVLEGYRNLPLSVAHLDTTLFLDEINRSLKELAARELLARKGYSMHLDRSASVKHDLETWTDAWLAEALRRKIAREITVTDDDVLAYLVRHARDYGKMYEVNVREILCDSLNQALSVLEQLAAGAGFDSLARVLPKRREWAARGGESGYFLVASHPEIGFRALFAGQRIPVGPVRLPEGTSIFEVLGKRKINVPGALPVDSLMIEGRTALFRERLGERLEKRVAAAAANYRVSLRYDRLKSVVISPVNMVTRRYIGFGGSIVAVPSIFPLWMWAEEPSAGLENALP